jgi:hypothetical protein
MFNSLTSSTMIEPNRAFRLGGEQGGAFNVSGRNTGPVPVIVYAEVNGTRDSITTLAPGDPVDARFAARTTAVFRNPSTRATAVVSIVVTGDTRALGMRYETAAPVRP